MASRPLIAGASPSSRHNKNGTLSEGAGGDVP
jgi:hypothetical protein